MIMMKTVLFTCALLVGTLSWAAGSGTSIGNGGVGIMENGKLYMLDLFEYSVHDRPAFGTQPVVHWLPKKIEELFPGVNLSRNLQNLFAQKISDVMRKDYYFGLMMMVAVENLDWRLVNSGLVRLDDDHAVMNPNNLVQIAVRQKYVVFIDRDKWQILDDENKVALLIHEVLYAMTDNQNAIDARNVTGTFFTQQFLASGYRQHLLNSVKSLDLNRDPLAYENALFSKEGTVNLPIYRFDDFFKIEKVDGKPQLKVLTAKQFCAYKTKGPDAAITTSIGLRMYSVGMVGKLREIGPSLFIKSPLYQVALGAEIGTTYGWSFQVGKVGKTCESDYLRGVQESQRVLERDFTYYR
jgi:hypothetical protein